ncbi:hypothetical protein Cgig2_025233 [Carnegiea gigantea]|uniref:Piwi domain-containing protein n=1 Tax=Carnegiea gigantea TaxID=171969 RepID=A0A9Q1GS14_9CARY|nr:hypothetical protein Cgig2_025233 [Carnegiea gigantea]
MVTLADSRPASTRRERKFKVVIKFANSVDVNLLKQCLAGHDLETPQDIIQTLDVVLRSAKCSMSEYVFQNIRRKLFTNRPLPDQERLKVCKIVEGQRYSKKLNDTQLAAPAKKTAVDPEERATQVQQEVERNNYNIDHLVRNFRLQVNGSLSSVAARVLHPPRNVVPRPLLGVKQDPSQLEEALLEVNTQCNAAIARTGETQHLQLLLIILPKSFNCYGKIKRICETELGIISQCLKPDKFYNPRPSILENVALKINAKVGGRNVLFDAVNQRIPLVSEEPIFDADVTHPTAGEDSGPSISAVVASVDWPSLVKYKGLVSAQPHRQEVIQDLSAMVRDGVSKGQFQQVRNLEVDATRKACQSLEHDYLPPVTFIVVQKRHHTWFFPEETSDLKLENGNILPVPSVYYAHLAASCARCYVDGEGASETGSSSAGAGSTPTTLEPSETQKPQTRLSRALCLFSKSSIAFQWPVREEKVKIVAIADEEGVLENYSKAMNSQRSPSSKQAKTSSQPVNSPRRPLTRSQTNSISKAPVPTTPSSSQPTKDLGQPQIPQLDVLDSDVDENVEEPVEEDLDSNTEDSDFRGDEQEESDEISLDEDSDENEALDELNLEVDTEQRMTLDHENADGNEGHVIVSKMVK